MVIDYVKINQLHWDCQNDVVIANQTDLNQFDHAVKGSIDITASEQSVQIFSNDRFTFRVSDEFQISGPFTAQLGSEMTVLLHSCPDD